MFFFISSRRRHTRLQGDWSSDVCSSDLVIGDHGVAVEQQHVMGGVQRHAPVDGTDEAEVLLVLQQSDAFVLRRAFTQPLCDAWLRAGDRKSTRLNSSHLVISYAAFCLNT